MSNGRPPYCILSVPRAHWLPLPGVPAGVSCHAFPRLHHCGPGGAEVSGAGVRPSRHPAALSSPRRLGSAQRPEGELASGPRGRCGVSGALRGV